MTTRFILVNTSHAGNVGAAASLLPVVTSEALRCFATIHCQLDPDLVTRPMELEPTQDGHGFDPVWEPPGK